MKKFLTAVLDIKQPISKILLLTSFVAGYLLATLLFNLFGLQIHRVIRSILY